MSVYKRGESGVFWYSFVFAGKRIQESAKTKSKTLAKEAEKARRRELELGYNGLTDNRDQRVRTFEALAAEYLEDYALRHKSVSFARAAVGHLTRLIGRTIVAAVSEATVTGYQSSRLKEGAAPKTINEEVGFLLRVLGERGDPIRIRLRRAKKLKLPVRERIGRALSEEERNALVAAARSLRSPHILPALLLSIEAGLRDSEIRNLQWGRVDLEKQMITVGASKTQAGEGRTIPIGGELYAALADHAKWFAGKFGTALPEHYCFPSGKPQPTDPTRPVCSLKTAWVKVKKLAGVRCRFHDGRHTYITVLAEAGASDEVIRSVAGHVSTQMLRHYSHIRMEAKREALAAVEALRAARRQRANEKRKTEELEAPSTFSATPTVVQ